MKTFTTIKVLCLTIFMFFVTTNLVMAQIHYDSSGDVGIGATSPELELDVDGEVVADHYYYRSDIQLKKNITTIDNALDKVIALRGVKFEWRTEECSKKDFTVERKIGFIAQEVEEVLPEAIFTDSKGYKAVGYGDIISVLVEAVKAQQVQIEELRARIEALEKW